MKWTKTERLDGRYSTRTYTSGGYRIRGHRMSGVWRYDSYFGRDLILGQHGLSLRAAKAACELHAQQQKAGK